MSELAKRIDQVLETAVAQQRIVGAVAAVHRRGELVYHRAVGLADREAGREMTLATPHRLASLTKPITSVAALALIDRGVLALDHVVTRWLPDFRPRLGGDRPAITLRQLLTHTSGLGYPFLEAPDGPLHRARVSSGLDQPGLSLEDNLRRLASAPLQCAPGSAFNYSLSTDVLGAVLERAADAPLPDVMSRHVTRPLDLPTLSFAPRDGLATPYSDGSPPKLIEEGTPVPFPPVAVAFAPGRALDPRSYPSGGAGMVGTAIDFARFLEALRTREIPGVAPVLLGEMARDQIAPLTAELLGPGFGFGFGAAVVRDPVAAGTPLSTGAIRWGGAYGACWFVDFAAQTSSVVLTNTAFEGMTGALRSEIERAVLA